MATQPETFVPANYDLVGLDPDDYVIMGFSTQQVLLKHRTTGERVLRDALRRSQRTHPNDARGNPNAIH